MKLNNKRKSIYNKPKTNYSTKPSILAFIPRLRSQTDIHIHMVKLFCTTEKQQCKEHERAAKP